MTDPKPDYQVAIMAVVPEKIGECVEAMTETGLANLETARSTDVVVWHKPGKFVVKHNWTMPSDKEYFVIGVNSEDQTHPGNDFPGNWIGKGSFDTTVLSVPNLTRRWTDEKHQIVNRAENNAFLSYQVMNIFVPLNIYIVLSNSFQHL